MGSVTSILGKLSVELVIQHADPHLLWPSSLEVKKEAGTEGQAELQKQHTEWKDTDFSGARLVGLLDSKPTKDITMHLSLAVHGHLSYLTSSNKTILRCWYDRLRAVDTRARPNTLTVRGDLNKRALGDYLRSSRSDGLQVLKTDGGHGRSWNISSGFLQVIVEALEESNTSLIVFCEVLDSRGRRKAHRADCICWRDPSLYYGRVRIVRRLHDVLQRNKMLDDRVKRAVADVLVPARVLLYAKAPPVPTVWQWNWRWSAGLWDEEKQWKAKRVKHKAAPTPPSFLAELPAEILERILELTVTDREALTDEQWRRLLDCVRDRNRFRDESMAMADRQDAQFDLAMNDWLHNGKMWWDRGVPPAETRPAKRRKLPGGNGD